YLNAEPGPAGASWLVTLCYKVGPELVLGLPLALLAVQAVDKPVDGYDAFSGWALKAKLLAFGGTFTGALDDRAFATASAAPPGPSQRGSACCCGCRPRATRRSRHTPTCRSRASGLRPRSRSGSGSQAREATGSRSGPSSPRLRWPPSATRSPSASSCSRSPS